jgi:hypothetical protein
MQKTKNRTQNYIILFDCKSSFILLREEMQASCSASAIITRTTTGQQAETDEYREVLAAVINGVLTWVR